VIVNCGFVETWEKVVVAYLSTSLYSSEGTRGTMKTQKEYLVSWSRFKSDTP
jgi:hypothetical protein